MVESEVWFYWLVAGEGSLVTGDHTMTLHSSRQSFVLEIISGDLFIRVAGYELSWNGDGLCICKGMKTLWANWH
jgi:hypothetical protein